MIESRSDLTPTFGSKRQVIIFPQEGPHGQRMIIASEKDLLSQRKFGWIWRTVPQLHFFRKMGEY